MTESLIPLASCQITQVTTEESGKSDWFVKTSNQEGLGVLPKCLNEKQAMGVIHFARKYELKAFNIGTQFQLDKSSKVFNEERLKLHKVIKELQAYNEKLSEKLEKFIISEE